MMNFDEMKQRLQGLDTACVSDANKALRVVDSAIRPIRMGLKLIGRAHTVTCHEDYLTVIKGLRDAEPGEVLVIDTQGSRRAVAGELFPTEAARKNLAGIVIDGPCRDTQTVRALNVPYYARSITPLAGTTSRIFETQIPITCGGVTVNPGDILFGDDDGILVATADELAEAIPIAEEIQWKEERTLEEMAKGISLIDMLNFEEHYALLSAGKESRLKFIV
ncbi:MAG: RraA family protein [Candidatus Poribacteria bacterium]|nr:RraA family protein [Candidatus Poribacteria bacterium]